MKFSFNTIQSNSEILYKDKGSKFFAYAFPVNSITQVSDFLQNLKNIHPKASHYCYAYRIGLDNNNVRCNDDGEPNNTAGKPILGQIDAFNLSDILIVVVRYFGGKKLGVSGLIDAYRQSAKAAIAATEIVEVSLYDTFILEVEIQHQQELYRLVHQYSGKIISIVSELESQVFEVSFEKRLQLDIASLLAELPHISLK